MIDKSFIHPEQPFSDWFPIEREPEWTEVDSVAAEALKNLPPYASGKSIAYTIQSLFGTAAALLAPSKGAQLRSSTLSACLDVICQGHDVHLIQSSFYTGSVNVETLKFDKPVIIPMLVKGILGNHMTTFYITKDKQGLHVEFFDGKALHIEAPLNNNAHEVYEGLQSQIASFKQLETPLQFDVHNCGVMICWFLELRLSGIPFEQIAAQKAPNIEAYREELFKRAGIA